MNDNTNDSLVVIRGMIRDAYTVTGTFIPNDDPTLDFDAELATVDSPLSKKIAHYFREHISSPYANYPAASLVSIKQVVIPIPNSDSIIHGLEVAISGKMRPDENTDATNRDIKLLTNIENILFGLAKEIGFEGNIHTSLTLSPQSRVSEIKRMEEK